MPGHDGDVGKPPVNLGQSFLDLVGGEVVQEAPGPAARPRRCGRGRPVGQGGGRGHGSQIGGRDRMQSVLRVLYPPQCISCDALVEEPGALCGACWQDTPFLGGGLRLLRRADAGRRGRRRHLRPVHDHRAAVAPGPRGAAYRDNGRRLVLALKHGDRLDLARPRRAGWRGRGRRSCGRGCWPCRCRRTAGGCSGGATTRRRRWRRRWRGSRR
jgi:hypothetical protein